MVPASGGGEAAFGRSVSVIFTLLCLGLISRGENAQLQAVVCLAYALRGCAVRRFLRLVGIVTCVSAVIGGAAMAMVNIDINLSTQTLLASDNAGHDYEFPISSGRVGHRTPQGTFHPIALYEMVHSAKYDNAPMPHSIFFLSAYAIHGTEAVGHLGHTASHGCIRLAPQNAATLFNLVKAEGAVIRIHGEPLDAGMRTASAKQRPRVEALGYLPHRRAKTLQEWMLAPNQD